MVSTANSHYLPDLRDIDSLNDAQRARDIVYKPKTDVTGETEFNRQGAFGPDGNLAEDVQVLLNPVKKEANKTAERVELSNTDFDSELGEIQDAITLSRELLITLQDSSIESEDMEEKIHKAQEVLGKFMRALGVLDADFSYRPDQAAKYMAKDAVEKARDDGKWVGLKEIFSDSAYLGILINNLSNIDFSSIFDSNSDADVSLSVVLSKLKGKIPGEGFNLAPLVELLEMATNNQDPFNYIRSRYVILALMEIRMYKNIPDMYSTLDWRSAAKGLRNLRKIQEYQKELSKSFNPLDDFKRNDTN